MSSQDQTPGQRFEHMTEQAVDTCVNVSVPAAREFAKTIQSGLHEVSSQIRSQMQRIDEATVPDTFQKVPKLISPRIHAWLDVAVTGYFAALGVWFALHGKRRPATAAFVNAGMVAGVSLLTDYEGNGKKPINFKLHGTLDAVQATKAALAPVLYDFADESEAAFFYGQAVNELAVIASTDWDEGMPAASLRKAA